MLQCWDANPDNRPTFHEIADIIERDIGNDQVPLIKLDS